MIDLLFSLELSSIFIALLILLPSCILTGYWLSKFAPKRGGKEAVDSIPGALLGLHALLIGFTFSMALERFELRREYVVKEANAIGTAILRSQTLISPHDSAARALLLDYLEEKVRFGQLVYSDQEKDKVLKALTDKQKRIWQHATEMVSLNRSPIEALYLSAVNEVIDLHSERLGALYNHVPVSVQFLLLASLVVALLSFGYVDGIKGDRSKFWLITLSILFSAVLTLILDLERPRRGWIRVSQAPMVELFQDFSKEVGR